MVKRSWLLIKCCSEVIIRAIFIVHELYIQFWCALFILYIQRDVVHLLIFFTVISLACMIDSMLVKYRQTSNISTTFVGNKIADKQRVLMHRHQGWNVRHGLCHIYMIYVWVVYSFCLFCCLFIIVTWWYMWCIVWQVAIKRKYRHVWQPYGYLLYHATVYTKPL